MAKTQRIDKILSNLGYGSRKDIRQICKNGLVKVDGKVVKDSSAHVDPENSQIIIGNEVVNYREFVYLMMHKPQGVISATEDNRDQTVVDLLDEEYLPFSVFPVGRLDKDTEGLLLLTNDGKLAHNLLSPKKNVPKTYYAKVLGTVTRSDIESFKEGVFIEEDYKTLPAELNILKSDEISEIELTIYEGKFHQVKRMFEAVDKTVVYLKRLSMGTLNLDPTLPLGEYRELTEEELESLQNLVR
ncbi:pseudouridine synthase [Alkaliphilus oremlandii]|uniref:Pseudouridine synthase n=1 Tax=Alkaliphilus oremlandii (strain OhILAs) TaxID=350688 RepID=A8MMB3_ALKOO|nr:pseudouridine synthase [Alkaliphilus oremlandii]ABW18280.1 pseudouridine synthase [Alkaliphilus oremlandii OhILAs]